MRTTSFALGHITYDKEVDAAYIYLASADEPTVRVQIDQDDVGIIGIEILNASSILRAIEDDE